MSLVTPVRFGYGYRDHGPAVLTEQQAFSAPEGIALRYGLLCGGDAPQMRALLARRGHRGRAGARQGVRGPAAPPAPALAVPAGAPYVASFAVDTSMRVSNAKAKTELGWQPTFPTYRDGIRAAATEEVPWRSHGRSDAGTRSA